MVSEGEHSGLLSGSLIPPSRKPREDRKSTRLNSSHLGISYAVFCLKKKKGKGMTSGRSQGCLGSGLGTRQLLSPRLEGSCRSRVPVVSSIVKTSAGRKCHLDRHRY